MLYRVKQFMLAITVSFRKLDLTIIDKYLNDEEKREFYSLIKSEQYHCIRVARDLERTFQGDKNINIEELIRLGLIHDLGKQELKFGPFKKALFVLRKKIIKENLNNYSDFSLVKKYYNHPIRGVNILKNMKSREYSNEFLEAVSLHHASKEVIDGSENFYLKYLNEIDDRN